MQTTPQHRPITPTCQNCNYELKEPIKVTLYGITRIDYATLSRKNCDKKGVCPNWTPLIEPGGR